MRSKLKRRLIMLFGICLAVLTMTPQMALAKPGEETYAAPPVRTALSRLDLSRRRVSINENWKFIESTAVNGAQADIDLSAWKDVRLPHDFSLEKPYDTAGEAESGYKLGGTAWYRKTIMVPEELKDKKLAVEFGGVYMNATVYLNGHRLGSHPYGYTPFAFDLTPHLEYGKENTLAVKVEHKFPSSRWYSGSGIYRSVNLVVTEPIHVDRYGVTVTTPELNAEHPESVPTKVRTSVVNQGSETRAVTVKQSIKDGEAVLQTAQTEAQSIEGNGKAIFESDLTVSNPTLWSPNEPKLYTVETTVMIGDQAVDRMITEFGYRTIQMDPNRGFLLNGQPLKLQGVCMHHDQGALGAAAYYRAIERQVEILKEMGANAIRVTHNPASEELIHIANHKGMLLVEEAFDTWTSYKNGNNHDYGEWFDREIEAGNQILGATVGMKWSQLDLETMVRRGINAPAIIMWSLGNEVMESITPNSYDHFDQLTEKMAGWVEAIDPTRFITVGDNKMKEAGGDQKREGEEIAGVLMKHKGAVGFNYADGQKFDLYHRQQPTWNMYASETASAINSRGVYNAEPESNSVLTSYDDRTVGWGHKAAQAWHMIAQRDYMAGEFIWTGFDYLGEPTPSNNPGRGIVGAWPSPKSSYFGIVDTAGLPKDRYYFYRSQWMKDGRTLHILPAWHSDMVRKDAQNKVKVIVYSDAKEVELQFTSKNGDTRSLGKKSFTKKRTESNGFTYQIYEGEGKSDQAYENLYLRWDVPYEDGTITAIGYDEQGRVIERTVGRSSVTTFGSASKLELAADRSTIKADGYDLSYVTIDVKDANGNVVENAKDEITVKVTGNGRLLALDNGDQVDHEPYQSGRRKAMAGKLIAIVQADKNSGPITVTATAAGLTEASLQLQTEADEGEQSGNPVIAYEVSRTYLAKLGARPRLAEQVTLYHKDGSTGSAAIRWNEPDYSEAKEYTVTGEAAGLPERITVSVTMIEKVAAVLNYSTAVTKGTEQLRLPAARPLVLADGTVSKAEFPVAWQAVENLKDRDAGILTVSGTVTVLGETKEVTATVRIAEEEIQYTHNVAPTASGLEQDIPEGHQSDNLRAIIDKDTGFRAVSGGTNDSVWTNYGMAQTGKKDANIILRFATAQSIGKAALYFYIDSAASRIPERVELAWSETGNDNWKTIEATLTKGIESGAVPGVVKYEYSFVPIPAVGFRIGLTSPAGQNGNHQLCSGLSEVELMGAEARSQIYSGIGIERLIIDGKTIESPFADGNKEYRAGEAAASIVAETKENAAVTILEAYQKRIKLIVEAENQSARETYTVLLGAEPNEPKPTFEIREPQTGIEEKADIPTYELYPQPQTINFYNKQTTLTNEVNLVLSDRLDEATRQKAEAVLAEAGLTVTKSSEMSADRTNVLVGVNGSADPADYYFSKKIAVNDIFEHFDAYRLSIRNHTIAILGKDTDGAFYGLVSLQHLMRQAGGHTVTNLLLDDYASQKFRGTIEGFYGTPWSPADRADLIRFGGTIKNNVFIFAPKDDPYHRQQWRTLYPEDKLAQIGELAKLGNDHKNRFVWSIAPFHNEPINDANVDESIEVLIRKFDQLYGVGVRQFAVLADDIDSIPIEAAVKVTNRLSEWAKTKPEKVYDFFYCPFSYTLGWNWNPRELRAYAERFPADVQLFFTGADTCTPVRRSDVEQFKTVKGQVENGRKPLFWLNWPVNDIDKVKMRMFLGKPEMLNNDVDNTIGVVTNPMQEAHASQFAMFAIADYTWNTARFDADKNWLAGMKYVDSAGAPYLREISKHLSYADKTHQGEGIDGIRGLAESEEMAADIKAFEVAMKLRRVSSFAEKAAALKQHYEAMKAAVDGYFANSAYEKLKKEVEPYFRTLKNRAETAELLIDAISLLKNGGSKEEAKQKLEAAIAKRSENYYVRVLQKQLPADVGTKRINPNIDNMITMAGRLLAGEELPDQGEPADEIKSELISDMVEGSRLPQAIASWSNDKTIDAGSSDSVQSVHDKVIDYDGSRQNRWTNWRPAAARRNEDWVGVLLQEPTAEKQYIVDGLKIAYFEDHGCKLPQQAVIEYYDGPAYEAPQNAGHVLQEAEHPLAKNEHWKPVAHMKGLAAEAEKLNEYSFDPIKTSAVRIRMTGKPSMSLAVTELQIFGKLESEPPVVPPVDKTELQLKYDILSKLNKEEYTDLTAEVLEEALDNAQNILEDTMADAEDVALALEALQEAEAQLKKKADETPTPQ